MATTLLCMVFFGAEVSGNGTWWTIFGLCTTAITAQFAWNKKLSADLKTCQDARISSLEDKLKMVRAAKDPDQPQPQR